MADSNYQTTRPDLRLRFILSTKCNYSCLGCHQEGIGKKNSQLSVGQIVQIIQFFKKKLHPFSCYAGLTGGNPSLRTDIVDIVRVLKNNGVDTVSITDNGSTIEKYLTSLKRAGLNLLHISFHSALAPTFAKITGRPENEHQKVLCSVEKAVDILGKDKVQLNVTLFKDLNTSLKEANALIRISKKLGISKIKMGSLISSSTSLKSNKQFLKYYISVEDYFSLLNGVKSKQYLLSNSITSYDVEGIIIEGLKPALKKFCNTCKQEIRDFCLNYGEYCNDIRITPEGNIKPCLLLTDNNTVPLENKGNAQLIRTYIS